MLVLQDTVAIQVSFVRNNREETKHLTTQRYKLSISKRNENISSRLDLVSVNLLNLNLLVLIPFSNSFGIFFSPMRRLL